jgi:CRISPR-associated protein Cas1
LASQKASIEMPEDLHVLPKLRDSLSYLYVEHAVIERKDAAIEFINKEGRVQVPTAALCVLMLGPGTSITHAAIKALAECGCTVLWTGEEMQRFYAQGFGETHKAYHLLRQTELACDPAKHTQVVLRMYQKRFNEQLDPGLSLAQVRGFEGVRVRTAYAQASKQFNVEWSGRQYDRRNWGAADPINRALSAANSVLNSVCHAAIVSSGYSPAIGFIHTGRQFSFVYDVADLYKADFTIPIAFETASRYPGGAERATRMACREKFRQEKLLERILPDIDEILGILPESSTPEEPTDLEAMLLADLWEPLRVQTEEQPWSS